MLRSRFFWTLFGAFAALVLLTTLVVTFFVGRFVERTQGDANVDTLRRQCVLLLPHARGDFAGWDQSPPKGMVADFDAMASRNGVRITFIQRDGKVVIDTAEDPTEMENHRGRPEIQEALVTGMGTALRFGRTLGEEALYVALVERELGDQGGVVRVSMRSRDNIASLTDILMRTAPGALLAALLALVLGYFGARRLTAPVAEMTQAAKAFQDGEYQQRVADLPNNELGELGNALNQLWTELRGRVDRLSEEKGRLRAILAGMAEGVLAVDESDKVSFSNQEVRRLFDIAQPDLVGEKLWNIVPLPGLVEVVQEARSSGHVIERELGFQSREGERRYSAKAQSFQHNLATGTVVVFEDLTELRKLERVRQDFVANVSHELRTPLTSIQGFVETLIEGAVNDPEHNMRFLGKIRKNVDRLNGLVADLLSLARVENQVGNFSRKRIDLSALVEEHVQLFEGQALNSKIQMSVEVPEQPCFVWGEERSLIEVLNNLLSNALKYTEPGGTVALTVGFHEENQVHLAVEDTGIGIPKQDLGRVAERFYRVDKARSTGMGGTGLGLSIVKHNVGAMGGHIAVESELGKGSTFHVFLDRADARP